MNIYEVFNFIRTNIGNWNSMEYSVIHENPTFDLYFITLMDTSMDTYDIYKMFKIQYPNAMVTENSSRCVTLDMGYEVINLMLI